MSQDNYSPVELELFKDVYSFLNKSDPSRFPSLDTFLKSLEDHSKESFDPSQYPEDIKSQIADIVREREEIEKKILQTQQSLESEESTSFLREKEDLQKKIDSLRHDLSLAQLALEKGNSEVSTLTQELDSVKSQKALLDTQLASEKECTAQFLANANLTADQLPEEEGPYELIRLDEISTQKPLGKTFGGAELILGRRAGEKVVIKKFSSRREFDDEMNAVGQLHSGYVISTYGGCLVDRITVSEHLEKGNLYSLIFSDEPLPWDKRWSIACDICLGMWYLHSRYPSVMCADFLLTAYNVQVAFDYRAKIAVTGLGVPPPESLGKTRSQFDKIYQPPELLRGGPENYSEKSDVYAYAIVLWLLAEQKQFPWDGEELEKNVLAEERPEISAAVPEEFAKVIEWSWRAKPEARLTFRRIVKTYKTKGLLTNKQEARKEAASRMEDVTREIDILKQLLERIRQQYNQASRKYEREKQLTECCEQEVRSVEGRLELERKRVADIEKKIADLEKDTEAQRQNSEKIEAKKKKDQKNAELKQKRLQEDLEQEREASEKKLDTEKRRGEGLRKQLEETEQALEQERARRMEAEKRRDEYRARC